MMMVKLLQCNRVQIFGFVKDLFPDLGSNLGLCCLVGVVRGSESRLMKHQRKRDGYGYGHGCDEEEQGKGVRGNQIGVVDCGTWKGEVFDDDDDDQVVMNRILHHHWMRYFHCCQSP